MGTSKEVSWGKKQNEIKLTTGQLMISILNGKVNYSFEEWVEAIYEIAKTVYNYTPNGDRKNESVWPRRAIIGIATAYWRGKKTLSETGTILAKCENRKNKYDHSTLIYNYNKHLEHVKYKDYGYEEYYQLYSRLLYRCKALGLINRCDFDEL